MSLTETKSTNVMIAEDDDDDFFIFSVAISETGFTVILKRAEDGELLMKLLQEEIPDVLFLDLLMPLKDGKQALRELRGDKRYDSMPIIVYTALDDLDTVEYCYRQGSNLYSVKPNSIEDLKTALQRILAIDWKKTMYFPPKAEYIIGKHRPKGWGA
ncbi:MAG TPA: response regulator [Cyclobacteriaceae bacterium]|nr:response regulator [Cyclobacteriaceae bacterium]